MGKLAIVTVSALATLLGACASGRVPSPEPAALAAPEDTLAFAYLPRSIANYPDYASFRQDEGTEIQAIAGALEENRLAAEEVKAPDIRLLQRLAVADSAVPAEDIAALRPGARRLLLILGPPSGEGGPSAAARLDEAVGHAFRAILFDRSEGRVLRDTVAAFAAAEVPEGKAEPEPRARGHYRRVVRDLLSGL